MKNIFLFQSIFLTEVEYQENSSEAWSLAINPMENKLISLISLQTEPWWCLQWYETSVCVRRYTRWGPESEGVTGIVWWQSLPQSTVTTTHHHRHPHQLQQHSSVGHTQPLSDQSIRVPTFPPSSFCYLIFYLEKIIIATNINFSG